MDKPLFSHYALKQKFLTAVNNKPEEMNAYWNSIVFISETLEIYTHGKFYGIPETWLDKIEELEEQFQRLATGSRDTQAQLDAFYKEWLLSLENSAEGLKNLVPWTDGNHNRIALPYVADADTSAGGGEAGQIIGLPNPNAESIGGAAPNGNAVLVQLNKWNVQDFGSGRYPTNINGSGERPTYNDNKPIALVEDVDKKVSWSDEYKNRIVLPYNDSERPGKGAGQVIAYANPECKEGGKVWSDSWKNLETTDSYLKKYGKVGEVSPNFYKEGAPAVVLAQMSQYNVQEYGSQTYPINLQGSKVRPTYNDNEELALISDVEAAVDGATKFFDSIEYDKEEKKVYFKNGETTKAELDVADFILDKAVEDVEYNEETHELVFTFNTDSGGKEIKVNLEKLVDVYTGANVKLTYVGLPESYSLPEVGDSVDMAISKLAKGIEELLTSVDGINIREENTGDYISITGEMVEGEIQLTPVLTTQAIATASEEKKGLAEASDVKNYVNNMFAWEEID